MSTNEEFDELARRKLAEQAFPYHEEDWQAARKLIAAERRRRKRGAWIAAAALLTLSCGLLWFGTRDRDKKDEPLAATERSTSRPTAVSAPERSVLPAAGPGPEAHSTANAPATAAEPHAPSSPALPALQPAPAAKALPAAGTTAQAATHPLKRQEAMNATAPPEPAPGAPPATINMNAQAQPSVPVSPVGAEGKTAADGTAASTAAATQPVSPPLPPPAAEAPHGQQHPAVQEAAQAAPIATATPEPGVQPRPEAAAASSDPASESAASATLPTDSAAAAALLPPLVPAHAPWEVGILGGMFTSTTRYAGLDHAGWNTATGKENSIGVGAELMHLGRNFGIGAGIHFTAYAERLRTPASDRSVASVQQHWFMLAVDTSVFVVTGTVPGTPPTYTGNSLDTTVYVLAHTTETTYGTQRLREARDQVNRVSYLEIPLLLDAHVVQGRWSLGLRGGPALGLLTGRRGTLPNGTGDGYVAINDVAFRALIPGYTARAYLRYRFNAAWSVGVEPTLRGQFGNSLDGTTLERRSTAKGVLVGLSYRLR